ncbi:hypothetical protein [Pseudomonas syringae pv. coryli]|uniref:hypothetical protein n=1 Tax=Pseudomonas syringae pv. coryli TaxID=317659 RepID=UPI003D2BB9EC
MKISIGEKAETVMRSRRTGNYGEYLGSRAGVFGIAKVDGMTFQVDSLSEFGPKKATHLETGNVEIFEDSFEFPCAIDLLVKRQRDTVQVTLEGRA